MAHPEAEWPSQESSLIFYCFLFHHFLVPLADNFGRTDARTSSMGNFMFVQGGG